MSHDDCSISIPPLPPLELTRSTSAMSLTTPCSTTMKVAGLTPFQSFLLRPADTRSVIVFIVACIGTFVLLLHVKKLVDSFSPPSASTSEHGMSASRHAMTTLSINDIIPPTKAPTQQPQQQQQQQQLHSIIQFTEEMSGPDGQLLHPITQYIPTLASYHILSLHALTMTTTTTPSSHYHTTMSELLVIQHGTISLRLMEIHSEYVEEMILSVDETHDHPLAVLISPHVCHTIQPTTESDIPVRMISYALQSTTSTPSSDPIKLLLSDRHTCPYTIPRQRNVDV